MSNPFTGLIMAGGRSRRFGSDKAAYKFGDHAMIEHVRAALRPAVGSVLISISEDTPSTRSEDPTRASARLVIDEFPGLGPLSGLHAGLKASSTPWIVVAACDMPFLTTQDVERLTHHCRRRELVTVAVDSDGRRHPLCACYPVEILPLVEEQLQSDDVSMRALLDRLNVAEVRLPDRSLRNINRPSDLPSR